MFRTEKPVILITTHADCGLYAYDATGVQPRMILGHDVQQGESRDDAATAVLDAVRDRLAQYFTGDVEDVE